MENTRKTAERMKREALMVAAAEKLFSQHHFDNVSMDEIARKAQVTKRTLYQYFTGKEDLFFAVALKGYKKLYASTIKGFELEGSAFEKLQYGFGAYYRFSVEQADTFRLIQLVGNIRIRTQNSPRLEEWSKFDSTLFANIAKIVTLGVEDGSMRKDLDPVHATFSLVFMTTGFFKLLSETGNNFTDHFNLDTTRFVEYSMALLFDSIRSKQGKK